MNPDNRHEFPAGKIKPFDCWQCGACCKIVDRHPDIAHLDRGDGTCKHLTQDNTCSIYEDRPDICNVRKTYLTKYEPLGITWDDYTARTTEACKLLEALMKGEEE